MNSRTISKAKYDNIRDYILDNINVEETLNKIPQHSLEKTGKEYAGTCPTGHDSKSGKSFHVIPDKNFFYCHNCKISGNAIDLVKLFLNYSYSDSIRWILKEFNLNEFYDLDLTIYKAPSEEETRKQQASHLRTIFLQEIVELGKKLLFEAEGASVLNYLTTERGYVLDNLKDTEFIYLHSEDKLKDHLRTKFPELAEFVNGLKLKGYFGDNFRLAIPYRNRRGQITGLLKRSINPKGESITTYDGKTHDNVRWDSTLGTNKDDLYGLDKIEKTNTLLLVEGYPEAAYLPSIGYKNIAAIGQGVLGKKHIEGLRAKRIRNVIISFDNDEVGPKNTLSAIEMLINEHEFFPFVLDPKGLSPHKDPDEYVRANGLAKFEELVKNSIAGEKWIAQNLLKNFDTLSDQERREKLENVFNFGAKIKLPQMLSNFIQEVHSLTGITRHVVKSSISSCKTSIKKSKDSSYQINPFKRYFPFIESSTGSYSYYDKKEDEVHMGAAKEILEQILLSDEQEIPNEFKILKAVFDVRNDKKLDLEKEIFNFFSPTEYMLLSKTGEFINPRKSFPKIYLILTNLFPRYIERKRFLNWLAGILQTREKQLTAWVLKGEPGAGKGVFLEHVLQPIFGKKQAIKVEDDQLISSFNPYLQNVMLLAFNEVANQDNENRNRVKNKIKAIITDSEIQINEKFVKAYYVENFANCLFYSNEGIPLVIEENDRRFNVVRTGISLRKKNWFSSPEVFLREIKNEVKHFAQFLINWQYDETAAKTVLDNDEKKALVDVCKDRYEEFSYHLKQNDQDWLDNNQNLSFPTKVAVIRNNKIEKIDAIQVFNNIYADQKPITLNVLAKKIKIHGIGSMRDKRNNTSYFTW